MINRMHIFVHSGLSLLYCQYQNTLFDNDMTCCLFYFLDLQVWISALLCPLIEILILLYLNSLKLIANIYQITVYLQIHFIHQIKSHHFFHTHTTCTVHAWLLLKIIV